MVSGTTLLVVLIVITAEAARAQNVWLSTGCPPDYSEILLPHEEDCTKYYLCSKGLKVLKQCPEETSFHMGLQGCEWSQEVNCQKDTTFQAPRLLDLIEQRAKGSSTFLPNGCPSDPRVELLLPHDTDCGKYYQCTHGLKVERPCPATLHFDETAQTCTYKNIANCKLPSQKPTTTDPKTTAIPKVTEPQTTETPKVTEGFKIEFLPNGCPVDMHTYFLIPHESDCKLYYQCNHGKRELKQCPSDLHFDFSIQGCNWSNMAKCNLPTSPTTIRPSTTTPTTTTTTTEGTTTTKSGFLPNGCPANMHIHHLLPHESDCTKFYQCTHGQKVLMPCPQGLHFDFGQQVCNWPNIANCNIKPNPTTENTNYPTTIHQTTEDLFFTTDYIPTETESKTTDNPTTQEPETTSATDVTTDWYDWITDGSTDSQGSETESGPSETDKFTTDKYEATTEEYRTTTEAYKPSTFEPTTEDNSNVPTITHKPTTLKPLPTQKPTTTEILTTVYKITSSEQPTTHPSLVPTTTFKPTTVIQTTLVPTTTTTEATSNVTETSPCLPGYFGNMAHPELCNAYYLCSAGLAIPLFCPNGYEFDPDVKICIPIQESGCTLGIGGTYTTLDPVFTEDSNENNITENTPISMTTTKNPTTGVESTTGTDIKTTASEATQQPTTESALNVTQENPLQISCPPGVIEVVINPAHCNSYYLCFGGSALIMHCPIGQEFDANSKVCVPIQNGGCTLGGGHPTTVASTVTTEPGNTENFEVVTTTQQPTTVLITTTTETPTTPSLCPPGAAASMPYPDKCNVYYLCAGEMAIGPIYCPTGQEFDFESKSCIAIKEGGCTLKGVSTTQATTTEDYVEETSTTHFEIQTVPSWNNPGVSPIQPETTYSPETVTETTTVEYIEEEEEEEIPGEVTTRKQPETTEPITTVTIPTTTFKVPTTTESSETVALCPPDVIVNVPHPEICDAYYLCFGGSAIAMYCPSGQEFDPNSKACVVIKDFGCTYNHAILTTFPPTFTTPKLIEAESSEEENDSSENNKTSKQPFTTVKPKTTVGTQSSTTVCGPMDFGHKPNPDMCNAFYMCTGGTAIPLLCADGLEFDTATGLCQEIKEGGCTYNLSSSLLITTENQITTESAIRKSDITKTIIRGICNVTDFGYVPHPEKCDSYYMCTGGIAVPLNCQKGYEFNYTSKKCVLITNGGCFARKFFYKRTPHIKRQTIILNRWHQ